MSRYAVPTMLCACCAVATMLGGCARDLDATKLGTLTVKRIEVVNDKGDVVAILTADEDGGALQINNSNRTIAAAVGVDEHGSGYCGVTSANDKAFVRLGLDEHGGFVDVANGEGAYVASLAANAFGGLVQTRSGVGGVRTFLGDAGDAGKLELYGPEERTLVDSGLDSDGAFLSLHHANGNAAVIMGPIGEEPAVGTVQTHAADGTMLSRLGGFEGGGFVFVQDGDGELRGIFGVTKEGKGNLEIVEGDDLPLAQLTSRDGAGELNLMGEAGRLMGAGANSKGGYVTTYNPAGERTAGILSVTHGGGVAAFGTDKPFAYMGATSDGGAMEVYAEDGDLAAAMRVHEGAGQVDVRNANQQLAAAVASRDGRGVLQVNSRDERIAATVGSNLHGGVVQSFKDDKTVALLGATSLGGSVQVNGPNGELLALLGINKDGGVVQCQNKEGKVVALIAAMPGGGGLRILDEDGKLLGSFIPVDDRGVVETADASGRVTARLGAQSADVHGAPAPHRQRTKPRY